MCVCKSLDICLKVSIEIYVAFVAHCYFVLNFSLSAQKQQILVLRNTPNCSSVHSGMTGISLAELALHNRCVWAFYRIFMSPTFWQIPKKCFKLKQFQILILNQSGNVVSKWLDEYIFEHRLMVFENSHQKLFFC